MPNEFKVAGYTYGELASAFGPGMTGIEGPFIGTYYTTGEFGNPPSEGSPEYQDMEITLPGVDGVGIKRLGFRGRPIFARMAFVGSTKTEAETEKQLFFDKITVLTSFDMQVPGGILRPSCRIVHGSATQGQWTYAGGMYILLVDVAFRQIRLT